MKYLYAILILLTAVAVWAFGDPPPVPASGEPTPISMDDVFAAMEGPTTNYTEVLSVEFAPICHSCGGTNHYKLSISKADLPEFWFKVPIQRSEDLKTWSDTGALLRVPADKTNEFFKLGGRKLEMTDAPKIKPLVLK